ncbi:hypothetical protein TELCIR_11502 [Teladorsagia circumcincta]|uniref:Uncharacterized protein n=1 Tax=Teladorsagia circumcincta TaxID=45464 RepID=A0A2G9U9B0_TELCI|nr:hypothetical protein TELCIR_11502 [Teladorsagia circumcincta]
MESPAPVASDTWSYLKSASIFKDLADIIQLLKKSVVDAGYKMFYTRCERRVTAAQNKDRPGTALSLEPLQSFSESEATEEEDEDADEDEESEKRRAGATASSDEDEKDEDSSESNEESISETDSGDNNDSEDSSECEEIFKKPIRTESPIRKAPNGVKRRAIATRVSLPARFGESDA